MARKERIYIRVTEEEKEKLQKLADKDHRSISDYIRVQILKEEEKMLTEKRLTEIMEEEVERIIEDYQGNKENFRTSAIEAVDQLNESNLTEEEARKIYREWLEESISN